MFRYITARLVDMLIVCFLITFISFLLSYYAPGDPAEMILERRGNVHSQEEISQLRHDLGMDKPVHIQYLSWLKQISNLDFGKSYVNGEPVLEGILARLPVTLKLALYSLGFIIILTVSLGIITAWYKNTWIDSVMRAFIIILSSVPGFLMGLLLIFVFCLHWPVLPVLTDANASARSFILPVISLGTGLALVNIRLFRASLIETLQEDFVKNLRAMGFGEMRIMMTYIIRNSLIPVTTSLGLTFGNLLTGAAIIETVFGLNGIGSYAIEAVFNHDYNVIMGYVVMSSVIFIIVNLIIDILYWVIDPRIRGAI